MRAPRRKALIVIALGVGLAGAVSLVAVLRSTDGPDRLSVVSGETRVGTTSEPSGTRSPSSIAVAQAQVFRLGRPATSEDDVAELRFVDGAVRRLSLADFAGKAVLLNLWATWCASCRKEMPALDRLQARLGGPAFEVVALSIDRDGLEMIEPFYAELGLRSLGIYWDRSGMATVLLSWPTSSQALMSGR